MTVPTTVVNLHAPAIVSPIRESTPEVVERATSGIPVPPDDFGPHQTAVNRAMNLPDGDLGIWLDSLTVDEARDVLSFTHTLADEHRRRAETANILESRLRDHLSQAANHGLTPNPGR